MWVCNLILHIAFHALILPWGSIGLFTYYPTKYCLFQEEKYDGPKAGFQQLFEFEFVYLSGPFATPIYLSMKASEYFSKYQTKRFLKAHQNKLICDIQDISEDILRIVSHYSYTNACVAAKDLTHDLFHISKMDGKLYGASSYSAIETLENNLNHMYRRDKSLMSWRLSQCKQIIADHRSKLNKT